jgi:steroid 5-alpha reductase family enzyme
MLTDILVYFAHAAVVVFGALTALWVISVAAKDASLVDIFWGFGFLLVGAVCLYLVPVKTPYLILLAALPIIWGLRLTLYLGKRNLGHGEDKRYTAMRKRAEKKGVSEMAWRLRTIFSVYWGQGLLIMIVSAPVWVAMATGFDITDSGVKPSGAKWFNAYQTPIGLLAILGALLWLIGFLFEAVGDWQLSRFIQRHKDYDGPKDEKPVMDEGLWKYTRHPNYFGNACMWWGIWLVACEAPLGWITIFAPLVMTYLLTSVSGKSLLENDMNKRKKYREYAKRTSGFFPWPPKSKV